MLPKSRHAVQANVVHTHTQWQDRMPKCCPNYPNPGRGCQARRPHFCSARFAHFSRIPHFCRVSLFRWISAGFGKFQIWRGRCGERSAVQYLGPSIWTKVSASHRIEIQCHLRGVNSMKCIALILGASDIVLLQYIHTIT